MLILFALLLFSYGVGNIRCATVSENSTDMVSLLDFQKAIESDPTGFLKNWNGSTPFCKWEGVTCSRNHSGRVVALELPGLRLSGQISPSVGNLTFLKTLDLSSNSFSGLLPPLNRLHRLQVLDLSSNSLQDTIPDALVNCSNLAKLNLSYNSLVGEIPRSLGLLSNIEIMWLSTNNLIGTIPSFFSNISRIQSLALSFNQLSGGIPDELGKLSKLTYLALGSNNLSGGFPEVLFNLSDSLQKLGLEKNNLSKALPPNIGSALPNLQLLFLSNNMFEGLIPASLGNASGIGRLELQGNNFTGEIPSSFGKLSNLYSLNLEKNNLEASDSQGWEFFNALTNCSLEMLSLAGNQLHGYIPSSIGNLSIDLQELYLGGNGLSGIVPPSIGRLQALITLALDNNSLSGTLEEWIGRLTKLQGLYLKRNNLTRPIPSSIGNLTQVVVLHFGNNEFEGPIPSSLGNLQQLSLLDLSNNKLVGNIPIEISNLKQLVTLDLSSNKLTGKIPDTMNEYQIIQTMIMADNILVGNIPVTFGSLKTLTTLNLSHNNLSGTIPVALNNLQILTHLDLSNNQLHGEIPRNGVFENTTAVYLNGNPGLCGGSIDLHMSSCHAICQRTKHRYDLVRVFIPIFGFISLIMLIYFTTIEKVAPKTYLPLPSFGKRFPKVSYKDLVQATGNFYESNLIGRGSYSSVYRGTLEKGKMEVAIKIFDLELQDAERSFVLECELLTNIRHRNLLPMITACSTIDNKGNAFKAIVYEFMPNGNMDTWLHCQEDKTGSNFFGLSQRISTAINIADALAYLHHDSGRPIVHCDIKPSNILLDVNMVSYLGDFGIARFYLDSRLISVGDSSSVCSLRAKGTIGYIAPEYAEGCSASTCGDVYSFGIVFLEMLTGKRPTDSMFSNGLNIVSLVERNFPSQILDVIDSRLIDEYNGLETENLAIFQCLQSLLRVALLCTRQSPRERINMREVASKMHAIKRSYPIRDVRSSSSFKRLISWASNRS